MPVIAGQNVVGYLQRHVCGRITLITTLRDSSSDGGSPAVTIITDWIPAFIHNCTVASAGARRQSQRTYLYL